MAPLLTAAAVQKTPHRTDLGLALTTWTLRSVLPWAWSFSVPQSRGLGITRILVWQSVGQLHLLESHGF